MNKIEQIMRKRNIRKYLNDVLVSMLVAVCICSCSSDNLTDDIDNKEKDLKFLAISLNTSDKENGAENNVRSTGTPVYSEENKIYSLEVLAFKSDDGTLDGYKSVPRAVDAAGNAKEIYEVKAVGITAGTREIYVIANAPDNYFRAKVSSPGGLNLADFKAMTVNLSDQKEYAHSGVIVNPEDIPIGGVTPSNLSTDLIMCGYKKVICSNLHEQQYLGYTTNNGRPESVVDNSGYVLDGTDPYYVERLAARVAFKKITFELPTTLTLEAGYPTSVYEYALDSVFMMNVKTASYFVSSNAAPLAGSFGHGNREGYQFFRTGLTNIFSSSTLSNSFEEAINASAYDATLEGNPIQPPTGANHSPLWFYVFENYKSVQYPTYFVIGARFDFISTRDGKARTVKCYYPIVINSNGVGSGNADHNFIKRNYQYSVTAVIKGLGNFYHESLVEELRSASVSESSRSVIEIEETVGQNLFPWIGNVYK